MRDLNNSLTCCTLTVISELWPEMYKDCLCTHPFQLAGVSTFQRFWGEIESLAWLWLPFSYPVPPVCMVTPRVPQWGTLDNESFCVSGLESLFDLRMIWLMIRLIRWRRYIGSWHRISIRGVLSHDVCHLGWAIS